MCLHSFESFDDVESQLGIDQEYMRLYLELITTVEVKVW